MFMIKFPENNFEYGIVFTDLGDSLGRPAAELGSLVGTLGVFG
jgi:hypothetical protein